MNLDAYDVSRPFEPWIMRICGNTARDIRRREIRHPAPVDDEVLDDIAGQEAEPSDLIAAGEKLEALGECKAGLDEQGRKVVALFSVGFTLSETGEALDAPKSTVQRWLAGAIEQLRRCMKSKGFVVK